MTAPRKKRKPTLKEKDRAYWLALGRFIDEFANTELLLYLQLTRCVDIDLSMAAAVFSGVRIDTAIAHIRRILQIRTYESDSVKALEEAFTQLTHSNSLRNDLVHLGATAPDADGKRYASNKLRTHIPSKYRHREVSPRVLNAMTKDLEETSFRIASLRDSESILPRRREVLGFAWKYKPAASPPASAKDRPRPKKHQTRVVPQRPSRA